MRMSSALLFMGKCSSKNKKKNVLEKARKKIIVEE